MWLYIPTHTHKECRDGLSAAFVQVGCVCNNAQLRGSQIIGHPTEGAMLALAHKLNLFGLRDQFVRTEERTFSSEKKWMGVLVRPRSHQVTEVSPAPSSSLE